MSLPTGPRLNRDFGSRRWGDESYALEELVAELGAAFLSADLQLTPEPWPDHASYIAAWPRVPKHDKHAIFIAASHAQRATDYLHELQNQSATLMAYERCWIKFLTFEELKVFSASYERP